MQYMLLIYGNEAQSAAQSKESMQTEMEAYNTFTINVRDSGALVAGEALVPTSSATTVRIRDGKALTTDGPFAETKEQLGGFYLVKCNNLDEAIEWASQIPGAKTGS